MSGAITLELSWRRFYGLPRPQIWRSTLITDKLCVRIVSASCQDWLFELSSTVFVLHQHLLFVKIYLGIFGTFLILFN